MVKSLKEVAQELVDGFFIGGGGDTLENANLTKFDLVQAVFGAINHAWDDGYERGRTSAQNNVKV